MRWLANAETDLGEFAPFDIQGFAAGSSVQPARATRVTASGPWEHALLRQWGDLTSFADGVYRSVADAERQLQADYRVWLQ